MAAATQWARIDGRRRTWPVAVGNHGHYGIAAQPSDTVVKAVAAQALEFSEIGLSRRSRDVSPTQRLLAS
jgi:hypothetical protein